MDKKEVKESATVVDYPSDTIDLTKTDVGIIAECASIIDDGSWSDEP